MGGCFERNFLVILQPYRVTAFHQFFTSLEDLFQVCTAFCLFPFTIFLLPFNIYLLSLSFCSLPYIIFFTSLQQLLLFSFTLFLLPFSIFHFPLPFLLNSVLFLLHFKFFFTFHQHYFYFLSAFILICLTGLNYLNSLILLVSNQNNNLKQQGNNNA